MFIVGLGVTVIVVSAVFLTWRLQYLYIYLNVKVKVIRGRLYGVREDLFVQDRIHWKMVTG